MDYFPRKSLSKYLITDTIDFNKHVHDIDIFINYKCLMWRKYVGGDIGRLFKITRRLELHFDQRESEVNFHKAISSPESPSNVSPGIVQVLS
jgi:hypothetical protein